MKALFSTIFLCRQSRKIHSAVYKYAEYKTYLQCIAYDDTKLQNYLKFLQDQYSSVKFDKNNFYDPRTMNRIISLTQDINSLNSEMEELCTFISELKEKNDEMVVTAEAEKEDLEKKLSLLKDAVLESLIPDQNIDDKDIIMELTHGVGGQEAMLFSKDMFELYCNFAQWKGWSYEIVKYEGTDIGGIKTAHIAISGKNAFKTLKYECGVHRVQRIPKTEKSGRIHTSTMTVAVLPQPSDIDIVIHPKDIELEFKRSSGAGGQHVNTTDSCVRIYHKSSGIVVECQQERDQHRNRALAMISLKAKLYERQLESMTKEVNLNRKLQVGSAGRSEKVRTYNFVQDRITDHRAHITLQGIESFFRGDELLNNLIDRLHEWNSVNILMQLLEKYASV